MTLQDRQVMQAIDALPRRRSSTIYRSVECDHGRSAELRAACRARLAGVRFGLRRIESFVEVHADTIRVSSYESIRRAAGAF